MILIDAGHGGKDPGAVNSQGIREANVNLIWAQTLAKACEAAQIAHRLTRRTDASFTIKERAAMEADCNLVISIHCNSADNLQATGVEVLHYSDDTRDNALLLSWGLARILHIPDRGAKARPDLGILRLTKCPAYLIELGFLEADIDVLIDAIKRDMAVKMIVEWIGRIL